MRAHKHTEYVFRKTPNQLLRNWTTNFLESGKTIARKLNKPRLLKIGFKTLPHFKGTVLYHKTKDILYVKEFLGHKGLDSTLIYINIEKALFHDGKPEEFHVKIAQTPKEVKGLLEVGFEYLCEKDGLLFFRKRK